MRRLLAVLILIAASPTAPSAQENRAATLFSWFEQGQWFELPVQFTVEGMAVPTIGSGLLVEDPDRDARGQRYTYELEFHADVVARCGESAVTTSLQKLRSKDHYVSIVAALALDRLLGLEAGPAFMHGQAKLDEVEKTYQARARRCFPELKIPGK